MIAFIDVTEFCALEELVQYGYDVQRHAERVRQLINLIYNLRREYLLRPEFSFANRNQKLEALEAHYKSSVEMLDVTLKLFLGDLPLSQFGLEPSEFGEFIFLGHASDAFHETTTTFYPIMHDLSALYQETPEVAAQAFGTPSAEKVGYYFLQNTPPAFVSSTTITDKITTTSTNYTRTFITSIDFNNLLKNDNKSQLVGWICSLAYLIASMEFITDNGYQHIGGGGVVPAMSSHGSFSGLGRIADMQAVAKVASIASTIPLVDAIAKIVGGDAEKIKLLSELSQKKVYLLLKSLRKQVQNMDYKFTSGHTGTVLLILKTLEKTLAYMPVNRPIKVGFLGAGGSILKSTILVLLDSQVIDTPQPLHPVFYDIDQAKLGQLEQDISKREQPYSIATDFGNLMRQCDIVISAITVVTDEMQAFFDAEFIGEHNDLASTIIIEDTYPSQLPIEQINEVGGRVVLVLGQEGSENCTVTRQAISYVGAGSESQDFTYGLLSDVDKVADYGCGAELLTLAVALHQDKNVVQLSGPTNAEKVAMLSNLWQQYQLVSLAPLQDGLGHVSLSRNEMISE